MTKIFQMFFSYSIFKEDKGHGEKIEKSGNEPQSFENEAVSKL